MDRVVSIQYVYGQVPAICRISGRGHYLEQQFLLLSWEPVEITIPGKFVTDVPWIILSLYIHVKVLGWDNDQCSPPYNPQYGLHRSIAACFKCGLRQLIHLVM